MSVTQNIQNGGSYSVNGGKLSLYIDSGYLFNSGTNISQRYASASFGNSGGELDISVNSGIFSGFSGSKTFNLVLNGPVPANFVINFDLTGLLSLGIASSFSQVTARFDGSRTGVKVWVSGGGFIFYSNVTVNIVIPGDPFNLSANTSTNVPISLTGQGQICYLAGTEIDTPAGKVKVEDISAGDKIFIIDGGIKKEESVVWAGSKKINARSESDYPIVIKKSAISDEVPYKDLYVTQEHCLYIEGRFIPARMLVNNRSIILEKRDEFEIYHVETENHSVILSDGLESETYLDTGNRASFAARGKATLDGSFTHSAVKTWDRDAAAPLDVSETVVRPLYETILNRAIGRGLCEVDQNKKFSADPNIKLIRSDGTELEFLRKAGDRYVYRVPVSTDRLWLCSRTGKPSDFIGPYLDDRRDLGLLVGSIDLYKDCETVPISNHLEEASLSGWHPREASTLRWTAGMAELNLEDQVSSNQIVIAIEVKNANQGNNFRIQ